MSTLAFTVLYRKDGTWLEDEVAKILRATGVPGYGKTQFPEYIIISRRHRRRKIFDAIGRGRTAFKFSWVADAKKLPFDPFKPIPSGD